MLDPDIHYLNHGSFGACPEPVFDQMVQFQKELEWEPIDFLDKTILPRMAHARKTLAAYVNCPADDLVYFPNPTTAINMVARSLVLRPGDEILTTNHEYGAMDRTWRFIAEKHGAHYINHPIPLPVTTHEEFVETFWQGVTEKTKVIFLSHITSQTALIFPVKEICRRARQAGILTIIDGAHAPGQIPVDLADIQPDIYTGACHKWLCAPKGAAFLYASKEVQSWLEPLVVSWGYQSENPSDSQFIDYHQWQGTRDVSAFLSVPAAIQFQQDNQWQTVQYHCRELLISAREQLLEVTGLPPICPDRWDWFVQMAALRLPEVDIAKLKTWLYDQYRVEVPVYRWQGEPFLRVSIQAYNTAEDVSALVEGVAKLLKQLGG